MGFFKPRNSTIALSAGNAGSLWVNCKGGKADARFLVHTCSYGSEAASTTANDDETPKAFLGLVQMATDRHKDGMKFGSTPKVRIEFPTSNARTIIKTAFLNGGGGKDP